MKKEKAIYVKYAVIYMKANHCLRILYVLYVSMVLKILNRFQNKIGGERYGKQLQYWSQLGLDHYYSYYRGLCIRQ